MSSQSNKGKLSLSKISDRILGEQNKDIEAYTAGHLNENHLWKPPEQRTHQPWESAHQRSVSPLKVNRMPMNKRRAKSKASNPNSSLEQHDVELDDDEEEQDEEEKKSKLNKNVTSMIESLANYTLFSAGGDQPLRLDGIRSHLNTTREENEDEFELPDIKQANKNYIDELNRKANHRNASHLSDRTHRTSTNRSGASSSKSKISLPNLDTLPITDKEMAYSYLKCPFVGTTKQEKFKNLKEFERTVLKKSDLTKTNTLHGNDLAILLEKKLREVRFFLSLLFFSKSFQFISFS